MRRLLVNISVLLLSFSALPMNAQPESMGYKSFFHFDAWPGKNGPLKQGFRFNVADYPSLSGFSISRDNTDVSGLGLLRKVTLVRSSEELSLDIGVAIDSTNNAHELLMDSQWQSNADLTVMLQRGDQNGIPVGDLNFVSAGVEATRTRDRTTDIMFVRNNVIVAIRNRNHGGTMTGVTVDVFSLAAAIDGKIKAQPNLTLSQFNAEKPVIKLTPASTSLGFFGGAQHSTALAIEVTDPTNYSGPIIRRFSTHGNLTVTPPGHTDGHLDNSTTVTVSSGSTPGARPLTVIAINRFLQFGTATVRFTVTFSR